MPVSLQDILKDKKSWVDAYYNAVRFYFWEPDLLSKITISALKKQSKLHETSSELVQYFEQKLNTSPGMEERAFERISRTEEPFNHQVEFLLRLAPKKLLDELMVFSKGQSFQERPDVLSRSVESVWPGGQPDILLLGKQQALAIEIKPPHGRSFPGQLAKYAYLLTAIKKNNPQIKTTSLLYLANGRAEDNFPKKTASLEDYKLSETEWVRARHKIVFKNMSSDEINDICLTIDRLNPVFLSFEGFFEMMTSSMCSCETEILLTQGLQYEMQKRGYINHDPI